MRTRILSGFSRRPLSVVILVLCSVTFGAAWWFGVQVAQKGNSHRNNRPVVIRRSDLTSLIVYDGATTSGDGLITARYVANLLGHFGIKPDIRHVSNYSSGLCSGFNATFICGMSQNTVMPASLLSDIGRSDKTVCWINRHLGQLTSLPGIEARLGLGYQDFLDDEEYKTVTYRGIALPKADGEINRIWISNPAEVQTLAAAHDPNGELPYAVRSGSFWYFADSVFSFNTESDRSVIFADLLHDILNQPHPLERRAMVRIEDVSADSDPADLRRVANVLYSRRMPFQVALIPIFKDPARRIETYLSDKPDVVDALHYMVARGGTIVLHGVTHQLHAASADDFEFWDALTGRATPDGGLSAMSHKLEAA